MPFQVLTVLAAVTLVATDGRKEGAWVKQEIAKLQGTWVLQSVECAGEVTEQEEALEGSDSWVEYLSRLPEQRGLKSELAPARTTLTIRGSAYVFRQGGRLTAEGSYRLDLGKTPKVMERTGVSYHRHCCNGGCLFTSDDTRVPSLYSVEGDCLKWCINLSGDKLPDDLSAKDDEDVCLLVFHRKKP
jgi:uncharacterized protein (TIGR03067 family)